MTETLDSLNPATSGLIDELPDAVIVLDRTGRLAWGNRAAERLFSRSLLESVGLSGFDLVHPDDLELVLRSFASVQQKERGTLIEVRVKTGTGWRLLEVIGSPVAWSGEAAVLFCLRDLTERRRFEVARNEEDRFRSLVHNAAVITLLVTPAGFVESVSGALSRVLGHDPERVAERPLAELVSEADRPALLEAFRRASHGASASNPVTVAVRLLRHAGKEVVPFELTIVNLLEDPTVGGFVVSAHDLTERMTAELELGKAFSLLTATLDATADGIVVVDASGRIVSFNRSFAEMWRLPDSVLEARDASTTGSFAMAQWLVPEAFETKVNELPTHPEAESSDVLEFEDGRVFERRSKPQRMHGVLVGRVWSFRDVTETRRTEQELRASEQRFRQAFKQGPLGVALVALDSRITNANHALCTLLGRQRDDLVGATLASLTHPDDVEAVAELDRQMADGSIPRYQSEARLVTASGDVVVAKLTASTMRDELAVPLCGLRIFEDVTERKRIESAAVADATAAARLFARLTAREVEILERLGQTNTAAQMADHLSVSVRTVESHLAHAYRKLGVRSREDAMAEFSRLRRTVTGLF
jgi:PAS domain S-box-containing protein